jgi:hypothetical protein
VRDRLVVTAAKLRWYPRRVSQIECLQDLHDFLCFMSAPSRRASFDEAPGSAGRSGRERGEIRWRPMGRSGGVSGESRWPHRDREP